MYLGGRCLSLKSSRFADASAIRPRLHSIVVASPHRMAAGQCGLAVSPGNMQRLKVSPSVTKCPDMLLGRSGASLACQSCCHGDTDRPSVMTLSDGTSPEGGSESAVDRGDDSRVTTVTAASGPSPPRRHLSRPSEAVRQTRHGVSATRQSRHAGCFRHGGAV